MKKSGRKLLGILLAISMTMAAVVPMQGTAAESQNSEDAAAEDTEQRKMSETENAATEDTEQRKMSETENAAAEDTEQQKMSETEDASETPEYEQKPEEDSVIPRDDSYDINRPVIENFEVVENGEILEEDDTVHFNLWMYDADSDIQLVSVELYCYSTYRGRNLTFEETGEGNRYTAEMPCSQLEEGRYCITRIYVEDAKSNYANWNVYDEYGQERYTFTRKNKEVERTVALSGLQLEKNIQGERETLKSGDSVTYTADVQCENETITYIVMHITCKNKSREQDIIGSYDKENQKISGIYRITDLTYPGEWELNYIRIHTGSGKTLHFNPEEIGLSAELNFIVDQEYDETKPVIESIDIGENGRTVQAGDTVEMKVKVQEAHPHDWASAYFSLQEPGMADSVSVSLRYNTETEEYEGNIKITESTYPGEWKLTSLSVKDTYGNYAFLGNFEAEHPNASRHYFVSQDTYDRTGPVIKSIRLDKNGQLVGAGNSVSIEVEVEERNPARYAEVRFDPEDNLGYISSLYTRLNYSSETHKYVGRIDINESIQPVKWELAELTLWDTNYNYTYLSECEEALAEGPWYFTVDPYGYDAEGPLIESVAIDKNGQWVSPGETVNIRIKVKEKNPSPSGVVYFRPQVTNVSALERVALNYNPETQEYTGRISITEDTYPCEWTLTSLELKDTLGHGADFSSYQSDWEYTYPWYYKVKSKNTYREDFKNVTFHFYGYAKSQDGSYQPNSLISSTMVENVGRRATLNELGIFPEPIDGVETTWKYEWHEWEVNGDTELLFNSTEDMSCYFYASYDKGCANVSLTYMSEESGVKEILLPIFVDKEMTYQEVMDVLELPEDAKTEDFAGFQLQDGYDGTIAVGEMAYLSAKAVYNNCQVAWNVKYLDQNGRERTNVITKSYLEGTRVSDALAQLEEPEEVQGMGWEGWVLTADGTEETFSQPMTGIDAAAVYQGKTTAEVHCSYRGKDGKTACGSKMMLIDGEELSDAELQGAATDAFKDAEHLDGLRLSEWTGAIQLDLGKYKKINFEALYSNCVVTLKYPDDTCQYVIVNQGANYMLPTENEKYEEILWEGFERGETIVVTEDRELLAADARLKGNEPEEPAKVKLSEDEIAEIIERVENAQAGEVIAIDMKKATVVPKEVLEAIQGKPVDIVLELDGYSWSIGGDEVFASNLTDIDLEVKIGTDVVPSSLVASIAEGKPTTQLSLTHNGDFGFRADLILNLGSINSGGTGSLYYYDSDGKLKFMNAGPIGEDGTTSLSFSHASEYVVVIDSKNQQTDDKKEENAGKNDDPETPENTGIGNNTENNTENSNESGNGQTGATGESDKDPQAETSGKKEKNSDESMTGQETISIRKNERSLTEDSGQTEKDSADSSKRKSPKTGE